MKILLTILFLLITIVLIFIGTIIYQAHFSREALIGQRNIENAKKVEVGMTMNEVINIMGRPDTIMCGDLYYISGKDSGPWVSFLTDSIGKVWAIDAPILSPNMLKNPKGSAQEIYLKKYNKK